MESQHDDQSTARPSQTDAKGQGADDRIRGRHGGPVGDAWNAASRIDTEGSLQRLTDAPSRHTLGLHLLRGVIAVACLVAVTSIRQPSAIAVIAAGLTAMVALRGCPLCWTMGLIHLLQSRRCQAAEPPTRR